MKRAADGMMEREESLPGNRCRRFFQGRGLWWDISSATLILTLPLLIFFRHNDYALWQPEVAACLGWVILAGVFWGGLMGLGRVAGRVLVTTFLLVLLVDVQTNWLTTVGLRLLLNVVGFGALGWLLRRRLSQVMVVLFSAMIVATLLQPAGRTVRQHGQIADHENSELPFVLHLIMDEYAAPEALDHAFDRDGAVAAGVVDFFVGHDFTLYSRAYSRLFNTDESIPNTLNRGLAPQPGSFWGRSFYKGALLARNDWFDRLLDLGYDLRVFQSDFITFAGPDLLASPRVSVSDYTLETVHALAGVDLPLGEKVRFIFGSYYRLSWFLGMFRDSYGTLRQGALGQTLHLPDWDLAGDRVSPLSTIKAMGNLTQLLTQARPGQAVFAHLLLPHFPYAFKSDCQVEAMGKRWLNNSDERLAPARNSAQGRALRYPLYLAQIACTNLQLERLFDALKQAGVWQNSLVIVHGDHGSRLNLTEPLPDLAATMSAADDMDAFGTLLAVKRPGQAGGLDRRQVPLDDVIERLCLDPDGAWPPGAYQPPAAVLASPWVLLNDRRHEMTRHPLAAFTAGQSDSVLWISPE